MPSKFILITQYFQYYTFKEIHLRKLAAVTLSRVCYFILVQEQDLKQLYLAIEQCVFLLHFFLFFVVLLQSHSVFIQNYVLKNKYINAS